MSRWSGKCDFYDTLSIHNVIDNPDGFNKFIKKFKITIGNNDDVLIFNKPEDFIPYYTHLVGSMCFGPEGGSIHLSKYSWLELEDEKYFPSTYRTDRIKEFDAFVKSNGYEPIWRTPISEREFWKKCPLGEPYYCEPKLKNGEGQGIDTVFCPYMYANRKFPCKKEKYDNKSKMRG